MKVYRVEHEEFGHGPYYSRDMKTEGHKELAGRLCNATVARDQPVPWCDGIREADTDHYCGFISATALHQWFHNHYEDLEIYGYHVAVYETNRDDVLFGNKQLMFKRDESELIETLTFGEFNAYYESESTRAA
jgi:hypothetical protein